MKNSLVLMTLMLVTLIGCSSHQYAVLDIQTPQSNGSVAHDYARVDLTAGTMCSLESQPIWHNNELIQPCVKGN
jgi:hypothetical protein